jgi:dihydrofolate synthase/folylpolyglutamate synthase
LNSPQEIEDFLIKNLGNENFDPNLDRINSFIKKFDLQPNAKIITVAGTNGKGSVTRMLARSLTSRFNVAQFTSPHLNFITERFVYNNEQISVEDLSSLVEETFKQCDQEKIQLSFYEFLFAVFLSWCKGLKLDYIVLEVGLGGRLDAVNALDAQVAVVTSIGRDHQNFLGNSYKSILYEKLAIARTHKPLVTGFGLDYLTQRAHKYCLERKIKYFNVCSTGLNFKEINKKIVNKVIELLDEDVEVLPIEHQQDALGFDFFGSHNPAAVRKLVQFLLEEHYNKVNDKYDLLILAFSDRSERDLTHMLKLFKQLKDVVVKDVYVTSFFHHKAVTEKKIKKIANENGIEFVKDIESSIHKNTKILVSGSNYFYRSMFNLFKSKR